MTVTTGDDGGNKSPYADCKIVVRNDDKCGWLMEVIDGDGAVVTRRFSVPASNRKSIVRDATALSRWMGIELVIGKGESEND